MNTSDRIKGKVPTSKHKDKPDDQAWRWNQERHQAFLKNSKTQNVPMFFNEVSCPMWIQDMYKGRSAFLICGGPSFGKLDHSLLDQPGMLTMCVNNAAKSFRPNMWTSVDTPDHFIKSIWLDPTIQKFVPICHANKEIFDNDRWEFFKPKLTVQGCPNVVYYRRNEEFKARQFLTEDSFNWGNHKSVTDEDGHKGGRSIMLVAIKTLYLLGVRRIYLLGCDMTMDENQGYHFDQSRTGGSVRGNTNTYKALQDRFTRLRPVFERQNLNVYNCNPDSKLTAFDTVPYEEAIGRVRDEFCNIDIPNENTQELYNTKTAEKRQGKNNPFKPKPKEEEKDGKK